MGLIQKIFGSRNQRELAKLQPNVNRINQLGDTYKALSDAELKSKTAEFKQKLDNGATLDDILCDAFAAVREASIRTTGMRHYDVQLIGGMVLHSGRIAEMRTGEGKTLVATLPTYLNALAGKGVHVITVNDYLAKRDSEWMGRIHGFLGLSTGVIVHGLDDYERQRNYNADITYGQNNEFGFDYLRDNMKTSPDRMVQRGLFYAVVDEVDSILIDEARTPLIISGASEASSDEYIKIDRLIPRLKRDVDYTVDEKAHQAMLTDEGVETMEKLLGVDNLFEAANIQLVHHVSQALRAHTLYKRNVNYLVEDSKVVIVDEHTGRKMPGRRWSDGLHQAIEAKEGVEVEEENQTLATVTFQNYFRMYKKLSGMTGTADTEASEFHEIYKLDVVVIPTNKPIQRKDQPDLVYKNEAGKFKAVASDIEDCYKRGQPVLVGTVSVEKSEVVANILKSKGVPFNVLNAKQHQREASIVAQAGRLNAVTIATNMAGRGTDIILGGNAEAMAKDALAEEKAKLVEEASTARQADGGDAAEADGNPYRGSSVPEFDEEKRLEELIADFKKQCDDERQQVLAAGGLKIVGTERHESRRIDNQLRGRAGRQGDPGTSRFYLSLQDDLLRIFGLDRMTGLMERLGLEEDVPIESPMVTRSIENAQKKVEGRNFDQRKNVLEYDDVMNQQRKTIYALRRQILEGRYQPEVTEEEAEKGIEPPPPVSFSGDWTQESLRPDLEKPLSEMVKVVKAKVRARDLANAPTTPTESDREWLDTWVKDAANDGRPLSPTDDRPGWRILRAEVWRQYGTWLDIEKRYEKNSDDELLQWMMTEVAASLIQQRERLYDVSHAQMASIIEKVLSQEVSEDEWDWEQLDQALAEAYDIPFELDHGTPDEAATQSWPEIEEKLVAREKELTRAWMMFFMRSFYLEEIDQQWIEHLKTMDALREGIGLQGYGQKDPKKEYKKAGFSLFSEMMDRIQENVIKKLFHVQIKREEAPVPQLQKEKQRQMIELGVADKNDDEVDAEVAAEAAARRGAGKARTAGDGPTTAPVKRERPKVGRNDPCPCGSGKKYKKCHGKDEEASAEG